MADVTIRWPLWAIVGDKFDENDLPSTLVAQRVGDYGNCLMLFEAEDLARAAIREMALPQGYKPLKITDPKSVILILLNVQQAGDTYVAFNLSVGQSTGTFEPVTKWLAAIRTAS